MKLHEYQSKELLGRHGVSVPQGYLAQNVNDSKDAAAKLGGVCVVKAQVHTGGRGKAGGIILVSNTAEAETAATNLLGTRLVTSQTGSQGLPVDALLIEEQIAVAQEYYLSVTIDNSAGMPVLIFSSEGGIDIEETAAERPNEIHQIRVDPNFGIQPFQTRFIALQLGLAPDMIEIAMRFISDLMNVFDQMDASLIEINPLVVTSDHRLIAGDAKIEIDDNALFRQVELASMRDRGQEVERDLLAQDAGIDNFIKLNGNIGCMVNGAGLAMATLDAIEEAGGTPANFLDIGTANKQDAVVTSLEIIGSDIAVYAVLINIFGGLASTDVVAAALVEAKKRGLLPQPVVVRLAGTNVSQGEAILAEADLGLICVGGFAEAAETVVAIAKKERDRRGNSS